MAEDIALLPGLSLFLFLSSTLPGPSASEVTTLSYGAIHIHTYIQTLDNAHDTLILFFDPSTQFPGNEKITLCNTNIIIIFFKPTSTKPQAEKLG